MKCPMCGDGDTKVVDSRPSTDNIWRRRECVDCGYRFSTTEIDYDLYKKTIAKRGVKK